MGFKVDDIVKTLQFFCVRVAANDIRLCDLKVFNYKDVKIVMQARRFDYEYLPCIFVGWDNTARRGRNGIVINGQNKADFKESLVSAKTLVKKYPAEERIVFINAWNEWAEGNHLEPCVRYGHSFLEAVREVVEA